MENIDLNNLAGHPMPVNVIVAWLTAMPEQTLLYVRDWLLKEAADRGQDLHIQGLTLLDSVVFLTLLLGVDENVSSDQVVIEQEDHKIEGGVVEGQFDDAESWMRL